MAVETPHSLSVGSGTYVDARRTGLDLAEHGLTMLTGTVGVVVVESMLDRPPAGTGTLWWLGALAFGLALGAGVSARSSIPPDDAGRVARSALEPRPRTWMSLVWWTAGWMAAIAAYRLLGPSAPNTANSMIAVLGITGGTFLGQGLTTLRRERRAGIAVYSARRKAHESYPDDVKTVQEAGRRMMAGLPITDEQRAALVRVPTHSYLRWAAREYTSVFIETTSARREPAHPVGAP